MKFIVFVLLGAGIWAATDFATARNYTSNMPHAAASHRAHADALTADYFDATGAHPPYDAHHVYPCEPYYICPGFWNPDPDFNPANGYWPDRFFVDRGRWRNDRWTTNARWDNRPWDRGRWNHRNRWGNPDWGVWRWHNSPVGGKHHHALTLKP